MTCSASIRPCGITNHTCCGAALWPCRQRTILLARFTSQGYLRWMRPRHAERIRDNAGADVRGEYHNRRSGPVTYSLDARPGQELVAGRIPARVPRVQEQTVLVLVAHVALQIVACPGRDRDHTAAAKKARHLRRVFAHTIHVSGLPRFHGVPFACRIQTSTLRPAAFAASF